MKKLLALITALICSFGALAAAGCNAGGGSDDNFVGLYDEVVKEEVTFTYTNDNMLYDFEEKEAFSEALRLTPTKNTLPAETAV